MAVQELNKVLYTDQDFSTAVANVKSFLQTNYPDEFNDYVASNLGQALIDIIAYAEQNLMWYLNRKVTDLYFPTAITPNSISKIARMLGYKSKGAAAAEVSVDITLSAGPYAFPVTITKGFQFKGPNNTIWEYRGSVPVIYNAGETVKTLTLSQGYTVVNNFISKGTNGQVFKLLSVPTGRYVDATSLVVKIDGVEWTEYPAIPFENTDAYEANLLATPPFIKFGDGVQGNVPSTGAGIEITYVICDGFRGRIASNSISEPVVGLVAQFQTIPLSISQTTGSVGGDDPEDIRSITVNAPVFQRTQDRAITKGDYDFLSNQYTNVARADAQIIRGVSGDYTINYLIHAIASAVSGCDAVVQKVQPNIEAVSADLMVFDAQVSSFSAAVSGDTDVLTTQVSGEADAMLVTVDQQISSMNLNIGTLIVDILNQLDAIDTKSASLISEVDTVVDIRDANISTLLQAINNAVSGCSGTVISQVSNLTSSISSNVAALRAEAEIKTTGAQTTINAATNAARVDLTGIQSDITAVSGSIATAVIPNRTAMADLLQQIRAVVAAHKLVFDAAVSGAWNDINYQMGVINQAFIDAGNTDALVSGYLSVLYQYLDENLADSCRANVVQVSVLGKDAQRRYVDPLPQTLIDLKAYLDDRKDVTHTVVCVTGTTKVVNANVQVQVRVSKNAVEDTVVKQIEDSLTKADVEPFGLLVEREHNKSLYLWEIDGAIRAAVAEKDVDYVNIKITGPAEFLDGAGNLVIPDGYVIQAGTVTIIKLPRF